MFTHDIINDVSDIIGIEEDGRKLFYRRVGFQIGHTLFNSFDDTGRKITQNENFIILTKFGDDFPVESNSLIY